MPSLSCRRPPRRRLRRLPRRRRVTLACTPLVLLAAWVGAAGPAAAATTCTQDWRPAVPAAYLTPSGSPTDPPQPMPPAPTPEHRAFHVFCGGHYVNSVWLGPRLTATEAAVVSRDLVARAVYPTVRPGVNPARGLTGLDSWLWATSDDSPVRMLPGNGPPIDLELRVQAVRWRFGDGTPGSVTGFGAAFPAPSPVTHRFERTGRFTITAQVVIVGRLRYEELDFDLPSGGHTVALPYDVVQVRSLLHAG